ncbi:MAG: winged helix-turn-helix transcriptional regulator [Candidatus Aenigmarchaeota archaeon]|nr:winged helix-turn-helix transcriptional regulator [Candidatus Aenigmarchaeota archaeon]
MELKKSKILIIISLVAILSFFLMVFSMIFENFELTLPGGPKPVGFSTKYRPLIPVHMLPIFLLLLIIAILPVSYYLISTSLERNLEKKFDIILRLMKKSNSEAKNASTSEKNIILKFLNYGERKVLEALIRKKGEILQSDICKMEGMNKLKTHRAVKELEKKGIIKTEKYGKTNRIILSKDVQDILK